MTDLHWALIAIAGFLLLAIFVYSRWQERRELARFEMELRRGVGDPLLDRAPRAASGALPAENRAATRYAVGRNDSRRCRRSRVRAAPADEFAPTIPLERAPHGV